LATAEGETCEDCGKEPELYMVTDRLWRRSGMPTAAGGLCLSCLSARIGRPLRRRDFLHGVFADGFFADDG